jgi:plastocyanin
MRHKAVWGCVVLAVFVGAASGCGERGASPLSPSVLSSRSSEDVRQPSGAFAPRRADNDGDGYEDPEPAPEGAPPPVPGGETPNPEQVPPVGVPGPVQLTINIVGSFGNQAFAPNPLQAAIGNTLVWTNNDFAPHIIVLDDGTPVGTLNPGQSSMPITLATETAGFHCTIHPSMVGQITTTLPATPGDPSQNPTMPDPSAPAPAPGPMPDPYGDDDGYEDDYYYAK